MVPRFFVPYRETEFFISVNIRAILSHLYPRRPHNPSFFHSFAAFAPSRENDGRAQIHLNPPNLVNPVKKSALLEFSLMVENAVHENFC